MPAKASRAKPSLEAITNAFYGSCPNACGFQYLSLTGSNNFLPEDVINVCQEEVVTTSDVVPPTLEAMPATAGNADNFRVHLPIFNNNQVHCIEEATRTQAESGEWKSQRKGRITASVVHNILTKVHTLQGISSRSRETKSLIQRVMGYCPSLDHVPAVKYGRLMEPTARKAYIAQMQQQHATISVAKCGLFVLKDRIYIGASPDALVNCDCCESGLLEIKCPLSIAHQDPNEVDLAYLKQDDHGVDQVKKNHTYYSQMQLQMGVTERKWCDLYVFTKHGQRCVRVFFDKDWWNDLLSSAEYFFDQYIVPELFTGFARACPQLGHTSVSTDSQPEPSSLTTDAQPEPASVLTDDQYSQAHSSANTPSHTLKTVASKHRLRVRRTYKVVSPVYCCKTCNQPCQQEDDIADDADNSVPNVRCGFTGDV